MRTVLAALAGICIVSLIMIFIMGTVHFYAVGLGHLVARYGVTLALVAAVAPIPIVMGIVLGRAFVEAEKEKGK